MAFRFNQIDPLGEYRWRDLPLAGNVGVEAAWTLGGPGKKLSEQVLIPHWKVCLAICRQWQNGEMVSSRLRLLGPVQNAVMHQPEDGLEIVAVRLFPEAAQRLLGISLRGLENTDVDLGGTFIETALQHITEGQGPAEAVTADILEFLQATGEERSTGSWYARAAAQIIRQTQGLARVENIAQKLDVSERTLRRHFIDNLDISPKHYIRIVRLQNLMMKANDIRQPDWSDLALECGYSDQAHMILDVKKMTGKTPGDLHRMRTGT